MSETMGVAMFNLIALGYGIFLRPWLWLFGFLGLPFSKTLRNLYTCHRNWNQELSALSQKDSLRNCQHRIWIHTSSIGEFESIRWLLEKLLSKGSTSIMVTYASPSMKTYFITHKDLVDHPLFSRIFFPLDSYHRLMKLRRVFNPNDFILLQYDFFPNLMRVILEGEPIHNRILLNFTPSQLPEDFSNPILKDFYDGYVQMVLEKRFTLIHRCHETASLPFAFPDVGVTFIAPHTRWANLASDIQFTPSGRFQIVGGNTHPSDDIFLKSLFEFKPPLDYQLVWVPHDVSLSNLKTIKKFLERVCQKYNVNLRTASHPDQVHEDDRPGVILFLKFGALKHLYQRAHVAYIGGGYNRSGIHNLIEPLSWGCPLVSGPNFMRQSVAHWAKEKGFLSVCDEPHVIFQHILSEIFQKREKYAVMRKQILHARNHMRRGALAIPDRLPLF
jgi:3-deoxy-D-manno-octulosonic-acid transferase